MYFTFPYICNIRHFKRDGVVSPYTILARTFLRTANTLQCSQTLDPFTVTHTSTDLYLAHPLETWTPFDIVVNSAYALLIMPVACKPTNVVISPFIRYSGTSAYSTKNIFVYVCYKDRENRKLRRRFRFFVILVFFSSPIRSGLSYIFFTHLVALRHLLREQECLIVVECTNSNRVGRPWYCT